MRKGLSSIGALLVLGLGLGLVRNTAGPGAATSSNNARGKQQSSVEVPRRVTAPVDKTITPQGEEEDLFNTVDAFWPPYGLVGKHTTDSDPLVTKFRDLAKSGHEVNFAIAIVPDPLHTHLSLFFDRTIDAIQQGAQQAGWIFDRAIMPWDSREHPESTDFHVRLEQEEYEGSKEDLPGLMIFRPVSLRQHPLTTSLFVFVVGETPTGGINKEQFRTAITLIDSGGQAGSALRIIGPTFSGSLYSLAEFLDKELKPGIFKRIVIRSGTVSSWDTTKRFSNEWLDGSECVDFATFQQSDRYMLRKFVEFEGARGYPADRIAVLAEDETAYGNVPGDGARSSDSANSGSCPQPSHTEAHKSVEDDGKLSVDENSVLHLYFPRDISQLRSAYQRGFEQPAQSAADNYQVHSTLPLNLQDTGSDDDTVQQYAHSQTPLSQESTLLGIVTAMRKRHIEFVVLQATSPMDTLFLSRFLKKGYPDARIVAMAADLLLGRDADDVSLLHGVMALTTYSLLPGIDEQVARPSVLIEHSHADHIFPNAYAVGTYNAALAQASCIGPRALEPDCKMVDPSIGVPAARYAEYGWPSIGGSTDLTRPLAPVVWLTVLGRGGFWPLAILDNGSKPYKAGNIESAPRPIDLVSTGCGPLALCGYTTSTFAPSWPLFLGVVCGSVLVLTLVYCVSLSTASIIAASSWTTVLAPVKDRSRSTLIAIVGCLLLASILLLLWPWVNWVRLGGLPKACLIVGVITTALLIGICTYELERRGESRARMIFLAVAATLVVCFVALYAIGGHALNPFLYRYIHLTSGVSPLLPFLCLLAAALWWTWMSLWGLTLVDKRRPRLPSDDDLPAGLATLKPLSEQFATSLIHRARPATRDLRVYGPPLALFAPALFSFDYHHPLLSLETRHFEWIFALALGVLAFALLCTLFRLLVIWLECHRLLSTLDLLPLRRAFAELNFAWEPIWRLGGGRWQDLYRLVSRQLETLEHLKRKVQQNGEGDANAKVLIRSIDTTTARREEIQQNYTALLKAGNIDPSAKEPGRSDHLIEEYRRLQECIAYTCAYALAYLQPKWLTDEGLIFCEVASGEDAKGGTEDSAKLTSTRLAERFVALVYLNFILTVLLRMRTLAITAGGIYIFLLIAVNSYPFEPKTTLRSLAILMLICVLAIVGYVFAQLHRNSILSLVTRTKPGELGVEFWLRIGTFAALPLVSLLVSQFPALNNALFSWLEPAVSALK